MPSLEERVAYLEGRFGDHAATIDELRTGQTETRTDHRHAFADLRLELRDFRAETIRRFEALDGKIDRHFTWLVGIQVAVLVSVVGALVRSYYR